MVVWRRLGGRPTLNGSSWMETAEREISTVPVIDSCDHTVQSKIVRRYF